MKRLLALLPTLVLATGCASFSTMSTARTTPKDTNQLWIAPEFVGMTFDSGTDRQSFSVPQFELGFRRGVTDDFELGGKLWLLGAALEGKFQLVRSPSQDSGIDVAFAPSVGWLGINGGSGSSNFNVVTLYLNLPVGLNVTGGSQLVLTPKAIYQRYMASGDGSSGSADLLFVGGSVGYAWKLGTTYILPELSIMQPLVNPTTSDVIKFDGVVFQGGVGLLFGG